MKKNVPSDKVEAFLKNAFEEYAESPSEEVWERIAAETSAVPKAPFRILRSYPFWIGIAVALLVGFFIYHSVQVNQELRHINRAVEKHQVEIQDLQKQETNSSKVQQSQPQATIDNENFDDNPFEKEKSESEIGTPIKQKALVENTQKQPVPPPAPQIKTKTSPIFKNRISKNRTNFIVEQQVNSNTPVTQASTKTIYPSIPTVGNAKPAVANVNFPNVFELNKLATLQQTLDAANPKTTIHIPPALALPIQPLREKSKFYVGVNALVMKNWSQVEMTKSHQGPPRDRKEVTQPDVDVANSVALGIKAGVKIGHNWSIESGILHRSSTATATHQPMFKFKDRKFPPHGGGPRDCQFEYDLNTPAGTVAVAITVENTAVSTPDEEDVSLEIRTNQSLTYLSVPLLVNYRIGKSKLHLNAKGGALVNFLLDNEFIISGISSTNINFKPRNDQPFRSDPLYVNQLSLDYLLQVGIEYDLTRHLSLQVEPTFIGSLSNPSANRFVQAANYSAGLNVGMTWGF